MRRDAFWFGGLIGLLVLAAGAGLALLRPLRLDATPIGPPATTRYLFHTDLAGWYEITANERVAASPYNLSHRALTDTLPLEIGEWRGQELGSAPEIEEYYSHPDLALRREYRNDVGQVVWLTAIYSQGPKSFRIFEHSPDICYGSYETLRDETRRVRLARGDLPLRYGLFQIDAATQRLVYYWYQWDSPERDSRLGGASGRLTTDTSDGLPAAEARLDGFVNLLFQETLPWNRF